MWKENHWFTSKIGIHTLVPVAVSIHAHLKLVHIWRRGERSSVGALESLGR